ncbi:MAG TPA: hypothetical protein VGD66_08980 [Allosphingosinicella sp.]|jgi:hypothetical protein
MRRFLLLGVLCLAACGEPVPNGNSGGDNAGAPDVVTAEPVPVRIGELGPNFQACAAAGTTRHLEAGQTLPVRSAPFDNAAPTGAIPAGRQFFICARSLDQKWFGIVYDPAGALSERCGVSDPVSLRRDYDGPCASGWIASAFVKMIAGDDPGALETNRAATQGLAAPAKGG